MILATPIGHSITRFALPQDRDGSREASPMSNPAGSDRKSIGKCVLCGRDAFKRFKVSPNIREEMTEDGFDVDELLLKEVRSRLKGAVVQGRSAADRLPACHKHYQRALEGDTTRLRSTKFSEEEIMEMRTLYAKGEATIQELADRYSVSYQTAFTRLHMDYRVSED